MLIPIRCFTCGKMLADKEHYYTTELLRKKLAIQQNVGDMTYNPLLIDVNVADVKKTIAGEIMDDIGLTRICCRKIMLTHINAIDEI